MNGYSRKVSVILERASEIARRSRRADPTAIGYGIEDGKDKLCLKLRPQLVVDADPQQHEAASPRVLVVQSFLR
jgi:hypothetical protein